MADDKLLIEVDGREMEAKPGQMLIEVTDQNDVYIPRFCYHEKLSVAANCRMCLVEVENAPKPMPACATPVTDGMKVQTKSPYAIAAQKATMEFLLINHPLDCPICDQGGECELQDIALGFGRGVSRFSEGKRSVHDENLGPLIATDMTRCIHCTRCVRFGEEIAGIPELGLMGRGEHMRISTYIENSVDHELSGNIIDLCPVGALTNKPYRFGARAWEMEQRPTIAPHDCVGSNLYAHVLRGELKRVVPRPNEALNETWLSDRDRYSYEAIYSEERVTQPMVLKGDELQPVSWEEALQRAAEMLKSSGPDTGAWVAPSTTCEEGYLANRIMQSLGSGNIDHRLRRSDVHDQNNDPVYPSLGVTIAELEQQQGILLIGSNIRGEAPILAHRIRKAALNGASVEFLDAVEREYLFPNVTQRIAKPDEWAAELARLVVAAGGELPPAAAAQFDVAGATPSKALEATPSIILLGQLVQRHPAFGMIRYLAAVLAELTGSKLGYISEGANSAGLSLAGVLPHRDVAGKPAEHRGKSVGEMLEDMPETVLVMSAEPNKDIAGRAAAHGEVRRLTNVVAVTPYLSEGMKIHAQVVLPCGTWAETSGTYVNCEGRWQSFQGVVAPLGESRPAWKILRVLGNLLNMDNCEYESTEDILAELRRETGEPDMNNLPEFAAPESELKTPDDKPLAVTLEDIDVALYQADAVVRRAVSLQQTRLAQSELGVSLDWVETGKQDV